MPLKHFTETALVCILAVACVVMAILTRLAPPFPQGFLPLVLLTTAGILYLAGLYPLLKRDRADNSFRFLHFVPAALPLAKLVGGAAVRYMPVLGSVAKTLGWGWLLLPVSIFFFLMVWFCLSVIRRRVPRLIALTLLFVPYAALAVLSERNPSWNPAIVAFLKPNSAPAIAQNGLNPGETWGERLEADLQRRRNDIPFHATSSSSSRPATLPHAGPGMDLLFLTMVGYVGTLHARAKKRIA